MNNYGDPFYARNVIDQISTGKISLDEPWSVPTNVSTQLDELWVSLGDSYDGLLHKILGTLSLLKEPAYDELMYGIHEEMFRAQGLFIEDLMWLRKPVSKWLRFDGASYGLIHDRLRVFIAGSLYHIDDAVLLQEKVDSIQPRKLSVQDIYDLNMKIAQYYQQRFNDSSFANLSHHLDQASKLREAGLLLNAEIVSSRDEREELHALCMDQSWKEKSIGQEANYFNYLKDMNHALASDLLPQELKTREVERFIKLISELEKIHASKYTDEAMFLDDFDSIEGIRKNVIERYVDKLLVFNEIVYTKMILYYILQELDYQRSKESSSRSTKVLKVLGEKLNEEKYKEILITYFDQAFFGWIIGETAGLFGKEVIFSSFPFLEYIGEKWLVPIAIREVAPWDLDAAQFILKRYFDESFFRQLKEKPSQVAGGMLLVNRKKKEKDAKYLMLLAQMEDDQEKVTQYVEQFLAYLRIKYDEIDDGLDKRDTENLSLLMDILVKKELYSFAVSIENSLVKLIRKQDSIISAIYLKSPDVAVSQTKLEIITGGSIAKHKLLEGLNGFDLAHYFERVCELIQWTHRFGFTDCYDVLLRDLNERIVSAPRLSVSRGGFSIDFHELRGLLGFLVQKGKEEDARIIGDSLYRRLTAARDRIDEVVRVYDFNEEFGFLQTLSLFYQSMGDDEKHEYIESLFTRRPEDAYDVEWAHWISAKIQLELDRTDEAIEYAKRVGADHQDIWIPLTKSLVAKNRYYDALMNTRHIPSEDLRSKVLSYLIIEQKIHNVGIEFGPKTYRTGSFFVQANLGSKKNWKKIYRSEEGFLSVSENDGHLKRSVHEKILFQMLYVRDVDPDFSAEVLIIQDIEGVRDTYEQAFLYLDLAMMFYTLEVDSYKDFYERGFQSVAKDNYYRKIYNQNWRSHEKVMKAKKADYEGIKEEWGEGIVDFITEKADSKFISFAKKRYEKQRYEEVLQLLEERALPPAEVKHFLNIIYDWKYKDNSEEGIVPFLKSVILYYNDIPGLTKIAFLLLLLFNEVKLNRESFDHIGIEYFGNDYKKMIIHGKIKTERREK